MISRMAERKIFFVEMLDEIVRTVLYSAWIEEEVPISILLIGPSGVGKSMMLTRYSCPFFVRTDSISSKGLYDLAKKDEQNTLRYLLIPDMNPTLSRKPSTTEATAANLLSFVSDGTVRVDDGREEKTCKHRPVGIISAATTEVYRKQSKKWFALGLRRRIIPVFYEYADSTIDKLQDLVSDSKIKSSLPQAIPLMNGKNGLEKMKSSRPFIPKEIQDKIKIKSEKFSTMLGKDTTYDKGKKKHFWFVQTIIPISPQITLSNLARSHALMNHRAAVNNSDYDFLCNFLDFCDPERPKAI